MQIAHGSVGATRAGGGGGVGAVSFGRFFGRAVVQRPAAASARHGLVDEPHLARHVASFLATAPRRISAREVVAAAHAREALASALAAHDSEEEAG